ncbi:MAG: prephenate dehydratase [Candidatus Peregrinibacteria bacterium]
MTPLRNIAVLGPKNTFSDIAADKFLKKSGLKLKKLFARDIDEVFSVVEKGKAVMGIAPVENALHGTVRETLDCLFQSKVHIISEISLPVHHCLISLSNSNTRGIKRILSHYQALGQCKKYLKKHFPNASLESFQSTTAAIKRLQNSSDKSIAVIAPEVAANQNGLRILAKNIEDKKDNATVFVIIGKGRISEKPTTDSKSKTPTTSEQKIRSKTSIAFHFSKDSPGSLFTVFKDFADAGINMTKIESRPTKTKFGDYIFYLDFDGLLSDPKVRKTLEKVARKVAKLKILGSY